MLLAQDKPAVSEEEGKILALESLWNRAEQAKDIGALSKLFAPNMIYVDHEGTLQTGDQFFNSVKNDNSPLDQLVTGRSTKNGKNTAIPGRLTDSWTKMNGNWQCVASSATPVTK
jgi:ketosteroid isomerase-like protein